MAERFVLAAESSIKYNDYTATSHGQRKGMIRNASFTMKHPKCGSLAF